MALGLGLGWPFAQRSASTMLAQNLAYAKPALPDLASFGGMWHDADDLTGSAGDAISLWTNRASSTHATQVVANNRPAIANWIKDGTKKCASFDKSVTVRWLDTTAHLPPLTIGRGSSLWIVYYTPTATGPLCALALSQGGTNSQVLVGYSGAEFQNYYNAGGVSCRATTAPITTRLATTGSIVRGARDSDGSSDGSAIAECNGVGNSLYRNNPYEGTLTPTSGAIGAVGGANGFSGQIRAIGATSRALNASELMGIWRYYGVQPLNVYADGNSLSAGVGGTVWTTLLKNLYNAEYAPSTIQNGAIGGCRTSELGYRYVVNAIRNQWRPSCANVFVAWEITNDIYYGASAEQATTRFADYCNRVLSDGWVLFTGTVLKRSTFSAGQELIRQSVNASLLANVNNQFGIVVDFASRPEFQDTGNTTYFSDGVHLTTAGYTIIAQMIHDAIASALA